MQAIQLIELATVVVFFAEPFIEGRTGLGQPALERYWRHSKSRLYQCQLALQGARRRERLEGDSAVFFHAIAEEILAADVLNRIWTSVGGAIRSSDLAERAQPLLQSVYMGHAEVRSQLLQFLKERDYNHPLVRRLDRCRQLAESWTDLLLAFLPEDAAQPQAFDARRVADFRRAIDSPTYRQDTFCRIVANVKSTSGTFGQLCPHEDLNRCVAYSITGTLGPDLLDSVGPFKDLWQVRLTQGTQDTLDRIELLLAEDAGYGGPSSVC